MSFAAQARVATLNGARYAAQLGKHWGHNLAVVQDGEAWRITFPRDARGANWPGDALVTLRPEEGALVCLIEASCAEQRDGLKDAVARHVDRFAFREAPLTYVWE